MIVRAAVLWKEPLVVYSAQIESAQSFPATAAPHLRDRRVIVLFIVAWSIENDAAANFIAERARAYEAEYPLHSAWFLCNTQAEYDQLQQRGVKAAFINQNCLIDPRVYFPVPIILKRYDAVYTAQLQSWKRHELCSDLDSVAFIYHSYAAGAESYRQQLVRSVPGAHFVNHERKPAPHGALRKDEVNLVMNEARVGLCLSAVEGAMHSSVEYLLAGLPVVSTINRGGRDHYLHADVASIVEPSADAVAAAVRHWVTAKANPMAIREATIRRQGEDLRKLHAFIEERLREESVQVEYYRHWSKVYFDKLLGWETVDEFLRRMELGTTS